jgi:ribosomal protein L7Ae-like RNA K-turn-binding protein
MNNILSLLGLAARARAIILGEEFCLKAMAKHPKGIVFLATDAGENITKKVLNKSTTYDYTIIQKFNTEELSNAIGKKNRKLIVITDNGFNRKFREYLSY